MVLLLEYLYFVLYSWKVLSASTVEVLSTTVRCTTVVLEYVQLFLRFYSEYCRAVAVLSTSLYNSRDLQEMLFVRRHNLQESEKLKSNNFGHRKLGMYVHVHVHSLEVLYDKMSTIRVISSSL
jgi:hypothetical protein